MLKMFYGMIILLIVPSLCAAAITLNDDEPVNNSTDPQYYKYNQVRNYWAVAGVRSASGSDWDIYLYTDTLFQEEVASSARLSGVDFVVADYNHSPLFWEGVKIDRYSGSGNCRVEYEDDYDFLTVPGDNGSFNWPSNHVVHVWDVYLVAGQTYRFTLDITDGSIDLGMALFKSNGAAYYAPRALANTSVDDGGDGVDESFNYTASTNDWYGLVVWCNNANSGNFNISIGEPMVALNDDVPVDNSSDPRYYKYNQGAGYWAVSGVRSASGSDWDVYLYTDTLFQNQVASSNRTSGVDFVVADYNHSPTGWQGVKIDRYSGSGDCRVEYEDDNDALDPPGLYGSFSWPADHVVHIWDLYLNAGETFRYTLDISSGTIDLGMALFKSNGAAYYAGRWAAQAYADAGGDGVDESFVYTATTGDWYGLVVWCNNASSGNFYIRIGEPLITLNEDEPVDNDIDPQFYKYNQERIYWAVSGVRSASGSDWDIYLYTDTLFQNQVASSARISGVDFVVADYNHSPIGWEGIRVDQYSGPGSCRVEYENDDDVLSVPGNNGIFSWPSNHVVHVWDLYLTAGDTLRYTLDIIAGSIDLGMALFRSNGAAYYAGRSAAQVYADAGGDGVDESFDYIATTDDWYGLVIWCNNTSSGSFYIRIQEVPSPILLNDDEPVENSTNPRYYKYEQTTPYWGAAGVRSASGSDWDIYLYTDTLFQNIGAYSIGVSPVDFVVADYNHTSIGWEGVKIDRHSGSGSCWVEYENDDDVLYAPADNGSFSWPSNHVVHIWDIYLYAGEAFRYILDISSGSTDLGMALFKSNGAAYYTSGSAAEAYADAGGNGADESFDYTATTGDWYGLAVWCNNGNSGDFYIRIRPQTPIAEQENIIPTEFALSQAYPNPFNSTVTINYELAEDADVLIEVYDLLGKKISTLVNEYQKAGYRTVRWNAEGQPSGTYFYRLKAGEFTETKRMTLLK